MPAAIIIGTEKPSSAPDLDVPADAIAIDGTTPEKGDEVEFTVKAKVLSTGGKNLSVQVLEVNGQPVDQAAEAEEESEGDGDESMMAKASKADADEEAGLGHY